MTGLQIKSADHFFGCKNQLCFLFDITKEYTVYEQVNLLEQIGLHPK